MSEIFLEELPDRVFSYRVAARCRPASSVKNSAAGQASPIGEGGTAPSCSVSQSSGQGDAVERGGDRFFFSLAFNTLGSKRLPQWQRFSGLGWGLYFHNHPGATERSSREVPRSGEGGLRRVGGREPEANKRSTLASANQPISSILFRKSRKHCGGTDAQVVLPSFVFPFAVPTSIAKPDYHSHCVPNTVSAEHHLQIYSIPTSREKSGVNTARLSKK